MKSQRKYRLGTISNNQPTSLTVSFLSVFFFFFFFFFFAAKDGLYQAKWLSQAS